MKDLSEGQLRDFAESDSVCYKKLFEVCSASNELTDAMKNTKDVTKPADDYVDEGLNEIRETPPQQGSYNDSFTPPTPIEKPTITMKLASGTLEIQR